MAHQDIFFLVHSGEKVMSYLCLSIMMASFTELNQADMYSLLWFSLLSRVRISKNAPGNKIPHIVVVFPILPPFSALLYGVLAIVPTCYMGYL
jgi:hypothetical protein